MAIRSSYKYCDEYVASRQRMSKLSGVVYNKGHQKSRETTREIWRSENDWNYPK